MKYFLLTFILFHGVVYHHAVAKEEAIENIVITASRVKQEESDVLAAVTVFEREDIERIQPRSLSELLTRIAGVTTVTQGTEANATSLFFRGSNSDHVLVLVDGVRVGSATLGKKETAAIPVAQIERIEVVRGPRASLWGSDALGGVIQIFTRRFEEKSGVLTASVGSNQYWRAYSGIGFGEAVQVSLSAMMEASEGFDIIVPNGENPYTADQSDDDGYRRQSFLFQLNTQLKDYWKTHVTGQYDEGNAEFDASFGGDETDYRNYFVKWNNDFEFDEHAIALGVSYSSDDSEDNADERMPGANSSYFMTERLQADSSWVWDSLSGSQRILGGEWYSEKVESTTEYSETQRDVFAVFGLLREQWSNYSTEASLRYDEVEGSDSEVTYHVSGGISPFQFAHVSLSHATGFKAPSINALYWPEGFGSRGNPNLKPETSANTEVVAKLAQGRLNVELSVYQTRYENLIEWMPINRDDPFGAWQPENVNEVDVLGVDLNTVLSFDSFTHRFSLNHQDIENTETQMQLARRPYFSAFYELGFAGDGWSSSVDFDYQGARRDIDLSRMSSRTLVHLRFGFDLSSQLEMKLSINNLLDKSYEQVSEYPGSGRDIRGKMIYTF